MTSKKKARPKKLKEQEQSQKLDESQEEAPEGIAQSILRGLGGVIPGLGGLMKGLEKSEAFQERLREVEQEVEARLTGIPPKGLAGEGRSRWPRLPRSLPRRPVKGGEHVARVKQEKEINVDVFDEGDHFRVIVELPGVKKTDITADLTGDTLTISVDTVSHKYHRAVKLPAQPRSILATSYRNSLLEVKLEKGSG